MNTSRTWLTRITLLLAAMTHAGTSAAGTFERSASVAELFPPDQMAALAAILPADQSVTWTVRVPSALPRGVLVFVSPGPTGNPQPDWPEVLDRHALLWIAAKDFGNERPSNQRVLAALMGLTLARRDYVPLDARRYIAGMSGGGRIASIAISQFPQLFDGALYIVGADPFGRLPEKQRAALAANRYVFLTGDGDFNRREMRSVSNRYRKAGALQTLLIDLPNFGHQYPDATPFERALAFLATGADP